MKIFGYLLLLLVIFTSCSSYSEDEKAAFDAKIQLHLDTLNTPMQHMEHGLYYRILDEGSGDRKIRFNDRITFSYRGSFLNGKVFQTIHPEDPITFQVRELIAGWQDGLMLIGEGGEIELIIPPHLAYGKKKTELIPANSIVKYQLKVHEVK